MTGSDECWLNERGREVSEKDEEEEEEEEQGVWCEQGGLFERRELMSIEVMR